MGWKRDDRCVGRRPGRWRRQAALIVATAAATLSSAGSASADPVFGVVPQDGALPAAEELELIPREGVRGLRVMAHWGSVEPFPGAGYDWTTLDGIVRETTNRGITPLFFFYGTPGWAGAEDGRSCLFAECAVYPPKSRTTREAFTEFVAATVSRYGPDGDFWKDPDTGEPAGAQTRQGAAVSLIPCEPVSTPGCDAATPGPCEINPDLPECVNPCLINPSLPGCPPPPDPCDGASPPPECEEPPPPGPGTTPPPPPPPSEPPPPGEPPCGCTEPHPIRVWQIWNEQNSPKYFAPRVNVKLYARILEDANRAIKRVDPGADVMLGGMWGPDSAKKVVLPIRDYLERLYAIEGSRKTFDSIGLHPYSQSASGSLAQVATALRVAKRERDRGVGTWITEIGWAAEGPSDEPYVKGLKGQAKILTKAVGKLARKHRHYKLRGIYWYSWRDRPGGEAICTWCGNAGLFDINGSPKPAWDAYTRIAKR